MLIEGGRIASIDRVGEAARLKADARPAESFLLGLIGLILGVSVLVLAVRSSAVRIGLLGVVFASIGLWLINKRNLGNSVSLSASRGCKRNEKSTTAYGSVNSQSVL